MGIIDKHLWHIKYLEKKHGIRLYTSIPKLAKTLKINVREMDPREMMKSKSLSIAAYAIRNEVFLFPHDYKLISEFNPVRLEGENFIKDKSSIIFSELDALSTLYHELTHAIIYSLFERDKKFKKNFLKAKKYYSGKEIFIKSQNKKVKSKRSLELSNEAIANYITSRVKKFMYTVCFIFFYKHLYEKELISRDQYEEKLRKIANDYNTNLKIFVFGYETYKTEIAFTDAIMPPFLINYINKRFLSQELTFVFNRVVTFQNMLRPGVH